MDLGKPEETSPAKGLKRERCRVFHCKQENPPTERLLGSSLRVTTAGASSAPGAPQGSPGIPTPTNTDA